MQCKAAAYQVTYDGDVVLPVLLYLLGRRGRDRMVVFDGYHLRGALLHGAPQHEFGAVWVVFQRHAPSATACPLHPTTTLRKMNLWR